MSDSINKELVILLKGRDDGLSGMLDNTSRKVSTLQQQLERGSKIDAMDGVKKFSRSAGDVFGFNQAAKIRGNADELRGNAFDQYARQIKIVADLENDATATDEKRAAAIASKTAAGKEYATQLELIKKAEEQALKAAGGGLKGAIGGAAWTAGGLAIAGALGNEMQRTAKSIEAMNAKIEEGKGLKQLAGDMARALPGIGQMTTGFDSLGESLGNFADEMNKAYPILKSVDDFFGFKTRDSVKDMNADSAAANKRVDANNARRAAVMGIIADDRKGGALDDMGKARMLEAERDAKLAAIADARKRSLINDEEAETARTIAVQQAEYAITKIRSESAEKQKIKTAEEQMAIGDIYKQSSKLVADLQVEMAEKSGDATKAALARTRQEATEQIDAIKAEIEALKNDPTLANNPTYRDGLIGAKNRQIETIGTALGVREKSIVAEGRKGTADALMKIRAQSLENEAAAGNKAAAIEAKRLEIAERYKEQREEIERLERDSSVTAEQRVELERRKLDLVGQEARAQAEARRSMSEKPSSSWLDESKNDPKIIDARGQAGYLQGLQRRNSEQWRSYLSIGSGSDSGPMRSSGGSIGSTNDASNKTAENTKTTADNSGKMIALLQQMVNMMQNESRDGWVG